MKIFLWTTAAKKLLTNEKRMHRKFTTDSSCFHCPGTPETLTHLFRDCPKAKMVWNSIYIPPSIYASFLLDWNRWFYANLLQSNYTSMDTTWNIIFTFTCWHIWKWRCKCIFDSRFNLPYNMKTIIFAYVDEWAAASRTSKMGNASQFVSLQWSKPPPGTMKINVDGSLNSNGCIGAGGIMRDHKGTWYGGFMTNLGAGDILQAEAWGFFFGLQLAINAGVQIVEIESDSANLVNLLNAADVSLHPLGTVIANCKMLSSKFISCSTRHVHREVNSVADILAKASLAGQKGITWLNSVPAIIDDALHADISGAAKTHRIPAQVQYNFTHNAPQTDTTRHTDDDAAPSMLHFPPTVNNDYDALATMNVVACNIPNEATVAGVPSHLPQHAEDAVAGTMLRNPYDARPCRMPTPNVSDNTTSVATVECSSSNAHLCTNSLD